MKTRAYSYIMVLVSLLAVCGCQVSNWNNAANPTYPVEGSVLPVASVNSVNSPDDYVKATIKRLLDQNANLVENVFIFDRLPPAADNAVADDGSMKPVSTKGGNWMYADNSEFASLAALKSYVNNTYVAKVASKLFGPTEAGGQPSYKTINGRLCFNDNLAHDWGVSWDRYTFTYDQVNDNKINFVAKISGMYWGGDDPGGPDDISYVHGSVVLENGEWLLPKMYIYENGES